MSSSNSKNELNGPKMQICSWNVNGLRAVAKGKPLKDIFTSRLRNSDIICLQETKISSNKLDEYEKKASHGDSLRNVDGYKSYWSCATSKEGYSGVCLYIKQDIPVTRVHVGIGHPDIDKEGRVIQVQIRDIVVIGCYFPNTGRGGETIPYKSKFCQIIEDYCHVLRRSSLFPVVVGDVNIVSEDIDCFDPTKFVGRACFRDEEKKWLNSFLSSGFVDTFRKRNPSAEGEYTWWDTRKIDDRRNNRGWRLDYCFVPEEFDKNRVLGVGILKDVYGSDHCPVSVEVRMLHDADEDTVNYKSVNLLSGAPIGAEKKVNSQHSLLSFFSKKRSHEEGKGGKGAPKRVKNV